MLIDTLIAQYFRHGEDTHPRSEDGTEQNLGDWLTKVYAASQRR
jgi:hypothetical protein